MSEGKRTDPQSGAVMGDEWYCLPLDLDVNHQAAFEAWVAERYPKKPAPAVDELLAAVAVLGEMGEVELRRLAQPYGGGSLPPFTVVIQGSPGTCPVRVDLDDDSASSGPATTPAAPPQ